MLSTLSGTPAHLRQLALSLHGATVKLAVIHNWTLDARHGLKVVQLHKLLCKCMQTLCLTRWTFHEHPLGVIFTRARSPLIWHFVFSTKFSRSSLVFTSLRFVPMCITTLKLVSVSQVRKIFFFSFGKSCSRHLSSVQLQGRPLSRWLCRPIYHCDAV